MPSEARIQVALDAISGQIASYRSAATAAAERVRGMLAVGGGEDRARIELGALGALHIDAARFAELSRGAAIDGSARSMVARAADVLRLISDAPDRGFVIPVPPGERAPDRIAGAYRQFGRAFAAAQAADLVRAGRLGLARKDDLGLHHGFSQWTADERAIAPPIVAVVNGADLHASELAELIDGSVHIVVVVEGACPPAALVRLISPGTFVLQTVDGRGLDRFADCRGPAIAALVDGAAASFVHDPARGSTPWQRLELWTQPPATQCRRIGGLSARQQREELAQLVALATPPAPVPALVGMPTPAGGEAIDRLTDWLLAESGLPAGDK